MDVEIHLKENTNDLTVDTFLAFFYFKCTVGNGKFTKNRLPKCLNRASAGKWLKTSGTLLLSCKTWIRYCELWQNTIVQLESRCTALFILKNQQERQCKCNTNKNIPRSLPLEIGSFENITLFAPNDRFFQFECWVMSHTVLHHSFAAGLSVTYHDTNLVSLYMGEGEVARCEQ